MIGRYIAKGIPRCSNCIYYRSGKCIQFLGSHNKPIDAEIARYNDLMCGYNGTRHTSGELVEVKTTPEYVFQPHI